MKKIVYIDLDGVVADFVSYYESFYDVSISDSDVLHENKKLFAKDKFFLNLPIIDEGVKLLRYLDGLDVEVRILTAVGDNDLELNREYKSHWVVNNLGGYKFYWVKKAVEKAIFADSNAFLVDDREKSLNPFLNAGGSGYLFKVGEYSNLIDSINNFLK